MLKHPVVAQIPINAAPFLFAGCKQSADCPFHGSQVVQQVTFHIFKQYSTEKSALLHSFKLGERNWIPRYFQ